MLDDRSVTLRISRDLKSPVIWRSQNLAKNRVIHPRVQSLILRARRFFIFHHGFFHHLGKRWVSYPILKQSTTLYKKSTTFQTNLLFGEYVWYTPHPVTVTTRIITFLIGNPELNLHLTLASWVGGRSKEYVL